MRHLVIPCTARCLAIGLFSAFIALFATPGYAQTEVPSDWPLKPSGLSAGDEFRLMFMGKNPLAADSTDIAVYDAYVQGRIAAIGHAEIKAYSSHFKVLGSTATVNARAHTGTTGTGGVPIHWLNGGKVADDYGDFYDGAWDDKDGATLEDGTSLSSRRKDQFICTGTNDDGTTASGPMGESSCTGTKINISGSTLSGESLSSADNSRYLVLSGVFRVGDFATPAIPVIESVAVTSDPGSDGEYVKDDAIEVTVTFSEAVVVTGTPKIRLKLNNASSVDRASYVAADSTATELAFSYNVKAGDYSHDGISIPPNGILLSGGTIKNQAGTTDANLDHDRQTELSAHKVHVRPVVSSVTVASTPASGTSYATGETIWIDLTFNRKVSVFTDAGTPTLGVVIGTTTRQGVYTTTVGDDVVRFEYVVQAGDSDSDGIQIDNNAITWNGGFIIRQEHGDVADKAPLQVPASGGSTGRNPFADHRVNAVDVLGVDVDPTSLTVAEGGNDYYSVFLTAQPSGTVTVTPSVTGSSDVTVNPASLTFTTANWSVSQDVTVSAAQDADADTATIENTVSGANYGSVIADDVVVTVTITDDDTRGLAFSVSALSVPEGGSSTYTVALSSRPTATVTVAITGVTGTDLTLDGTSLTFTSSNWDQPQTVTVSSADDTDTLDDQVALTHTASNGDYQSLSADLSVNVVDDDVAMIVANGVLVPSSPLSNRTYRFGETIRISVTFDQAVVVDTGGGVPVIKVPFTSPPNNRVVKDFEYASGSGSATLMFEYQVQSADRDDDGIDIDNNALELNGGTIKDAWGLNADLSYTGSGELVDQQVDGSQTPNPARLTALSLTGIPLDPAFNESTTSYSANVGYDVLMTRVRTTPENHGTVTILPADADASANGHQVALDTGVNEITITVRRDGRPDGTYTVTVTRASTTVSIAAGAPSATYRLEDVEFTVTRAETAGEPLEVGLTITQDQDFLAGTERSPRVTILANATSATHTLATSDFLGEVSADGRLTATVDAGDGYDVGSPASAGVDLLVANPAVTLRLEKSSYAFLEDAATVTLNVVAETAPRVPVPANLSLNVLVRDRPGTAVNGVDYTFQLGFLRIVASNFAPLGDRYVATRSHSFTVLDDSATEGEESFRIELSGGSRAPGCGGRDPGRWRPLRGPLLFGSGHRRRREPAGPGERCETRVGPGRIDRRLERGRGRHGLQGAVEIRR